MSSQGLFAWKDIPWQSRLACLPSLGIWPSRSLHPKFQVQRSNDMATLVEGLALATYKQGLSWSFIILSCNLWFMPSSDVSAICHHHLPTRRLHPVWPFVMPIASCWILIEWFLLMDSIFWMVFRCKASKGSKGSILVTDCQRAQVQTFRGERWIAWSKFKHSQRTNR